MPMQHRAGAKIQIPSNTSRRGNTPHQQGLSATEVSFVLFFSLFLFLLDKLGELVVGEVGSGYAAVLYHNVVGNAGQTETGEEGAFHHLAVADNITGRAAAAA